MHFTAAAPVAPCAAGAAGNAAHFQAVCLLGQAELGLCPATHCTIQFHHTCTLASCAQLCLCTASIGCRTIDKWCCDYNDEVHSLLSFGAANTETLAELTAAFFSFWAWDFSYGRDVVSIRTGRLLTKNEKVQLEHVLHHLVIADLLPCCVRHITAVLLQGWTRRVGSERHLVGVEVCDSCIIEHGTLLVCHIRHILMQVAASASCCQSFHQ